MIARVNPLFAIVSFALDFALLVIFLGAVVVRAQEERVHRFRVVRDHDISHHFFSFFFLFLFFFLSR
ncbi:hypothetical protein QBC43DRAFT_318629 [Cladorrhinum sp. PSN259]|nr:hypothetical protein QBC43DRAFT_318629 [Cladorrhinum sp. PSN259]